MSAAANRSFVAPGLPRDHATFPPTGDADGDSRQDITFTQHGALDQLDHWRAQWATIALDHQIEHARTAAFDARHMTSCAYKHSKLVEAAARLLDAAERIAAEALHG